MTAPSSTKPTAPASNARSPTAEIAPSPGAFSESGYAKTDAHLNYQYQAFGVPGLGFKRGLGDDLVIAPYACAMASWSPPRAATANLRRLAAEGRLGPYGFYEAVDYTPTRVPAARKASPSPPTWPTTRA